MAEVRLRSIKTYRIKKARLGYLLIIIIGIISITGFTFAPPILQNEAYHNFSDSLSINGISNFWNVISNIPFLILGIFGIFQTKKIGRVNFQYSLFFIGIFFVAIGSMYYHINPNSSTLVWDRLPMTIVFTSLISIVISEFLDKKKGELLLLPLVLLGILSIIYWIYYDDLRFYVFVQFYPILAIPVVLILFKSEDHSPKGFWLLLIAYIVAKLFEQYDFEIHNTLKILSGHSLKHLSISVGIYLFIRSCTSLRITEKR